MFGHSFFSFLFSKQKKRLFCDMLQRKHIQVFRPQPSHSVPFVPLFLLLFFFFFFYLFSFIFFFSFFFGPIGAKKKRSFFSSLAVLVLDQAKMVWRTVADMQKTTWNIFFLTLSFKRVSFFLFVQLHFFLLTL